MLLGSRSFPGSSCFPMTCIPTRCSTCSGCCVQSCASFTTRLMRGLGSWRGYLISASTSLQSWWRLLLCGTRPPSRKLRRCSPPWTACRGTWDSLPALVVSSIAAHLQGADGLAKCATCHAFRAAQPALRVPFINDVGYLELADGGLPGDQLAMIL